MTDLFSAAKDITKAFNDRYELLGPFEDDWQEQCLAAAIRELADQVVPTKPEPVAYPGDNKEEFIARYNVWLNMRLTRNKILAVATELENAQ